MAFADPSRGQRRPTRRLRTCCWISCALNVLLTAGLVAACVWLTLFTPAWCQTRDILQAQGNQSQVWHMELQPDGSRSLLGHAQQAVLQFHRSGQIQYFGGYSDGQRNGNGHQFSSTGSLVYYGQWLNDVREGNGTQFNADDHYITYVGQWQRGLKNGWGLAFYDKVKKHFYEGHWLDDLRHGPGFYAGPDFSYKGDWSNNQMEGNGTLKWSSQNFYRGEFKNNEFHGFGTYRAANGDVYEGLYEHHRRNGFGTYTWSNGDKYMGTWLHGVKDGFGKLVSRNQTCDVLYLQGNQVQKDCKSAF